MKRGTNEEDHQQNVFAFHELFRHPETSKGLEDAILAQGKEDSFLAAVRKCLGVCQETNRCFQDGKPQHKCADLYIQSRGCLAQFIAKDSFLSTFDCLKKNGSYDKCFNEVLKMQKEVEKELTRNADLIHYSDLEKKAFETCGHLRLPTTIVGLDLALACSMSMICPTQFSRFEKCLSSNNEDFSKCGKEGRELMKEFQPFMEKVWVKDFYFLVRGREDLKQ